MSDATQNSRSVTLLTVGCCSYGAWWQNMLHVILRMCVMIDRSALIVMPSSHTPD